MDAAHFRMLFAYNAWANGLVVAQASQLPDEDYFATAPGLSFGSLHATLVHILIAEVVWLARFQRGLPPEALRDARKADELARTHVPNLEVLSAMWRLERANQQAFLESLSDAEVDSELSYRTQYDEPNTQPLSQLMAHLVNHGTQFRAEAAVRLSQLGRSPGDLDLIVWLRQSLA